MPRKRLNEGELARIISKSKYGIESSFGKRSIKSSFGSKRPEHNLESDTGHELEGEKKLQVKCSGCVTISIAFFRVRLADSDRSISEKALIDALCYAGAIRGDSEKEVRFGRVYQEKVDKKSEERTEVTIEYPDFDFDEPFIADGRTDGR